MRSTNRSAGAAGRLTRVGLALGPRRGLRVTVVGLRGRRGFPGFRLTTVRRGLGRTLPPRRFLAIVKVYGKYTDLLTVCQTLKPGKSIPPYLYIGDMACHAM